MSCRSSSTDHPAVLDLMAWPPAISSYTYSLLIHAMGHMPPAEQQTLF